MAIIAWWNAHQFEVSPAVIRSFTRLQIKGSSETEEKINGGEKYVSRKNGKPMEITFTIHLDRRLGVNVREEAIAYIAEANWGKEGPIWFYQDNKSFKLVQCWMMLTDATITEAELTPTGEWLRADVQLTLKQSGNSYSASASSAGSSGGGGYSGGGGGYSKASVKSTSTTTSTGSSWLQKAANTVKSKIAEVKSTATKAAVSTANKKISRIVSTVKKTTAAKKTTSTKSYGGGKMVMRTK